MATSQFGMSERNAALVKKFQGNGWAVTCSPTSQRELSAIIGLAASAVKEPSEASDQPELRLIHYQSDWADTVLERSLYWQPDNATAPLWVIKATENWDFALFQLPAPDRRWIVKSGLTDRSADRATVRGYFSWTRIDRSILSAIW